MTEASGRNNEYFIHFIKKIKFTEASIVDNRRHEAKINFGLAASRPRGLVDMSPFQTSLIRFQLFPSLQLTSVFALNVSVDRETVFHNNPFVGLQENAKGMNFTLLPHQPKKTV